MKNINVKEYKGLITRLAVVLVVFLILFNVLYGAATSVELMLTEFFPNSDFIIISTSMFSSVAYLLSFVLPVALFYAISKNSVSYKMDMSLSTDIGHPYFCVFACAVGTVALIIPFSILNSILFPVSSEILNELFFPEYNEPYMLILGLISTAVVPAFAEELLFRGMLISNIRPYGEKGAILISALAFGLMHQNMIQFIYATVAGLALGYIYVKTRSLWTVIVVHFANNFVSIVQSYLFYYYPEDKANVILAAYEVIVLALGIVLVPMAIIYFKKRKRLNTAKNDVVIFGVFDYKADDAVENKKVGVIKETFKSPLFIIFVVITLATSIYSWLLIR